MIRFCSKYILLLKTSIAADRSKNRWGMMTRSIICSHWKPKNCGWFIISQNFCRGSKRFSFLPKIGPIGLDILCNPLGNRTLPLANPEWCQQYGTEKTGVVDKVKRPDQQKIVLRMFTVLCFGGIMLFV